MGLAVTVSKKGYVELLRDLASDLLAVRRGAEPTTEKLAEREARYSELDLKLQLSAEEVRHAVDL